MFYTNVMVMGDNILFRGINKEGKRVRQKIQYKPKLFVNSNKAKTEWNSLDGQAVEEVSFDSIRSARDFIKQYDSVENFPIYGAIPYDRMFLSDNYGVGMDWDMTQVCVGNIDIEVGSDAGFPEPDKANEIITAITIKINELYYTFACGDYVNTRSDVTYTKCDDEYDLLERFIDLWTLYYPDVITGWNIKFFDFPYLINRMRRVFGDDEMAKKLSPWGKISDYKTNYKNKELVCYDIAGVAMLDYYELYRKFAPNPNQESYRLDHICEIELGENKLDYSEHENLHQLYKLDFQKFIDYNIRDVYLVDKLDAKMKLIELVMTLAYDALVNYEDAFSQVRMWDTITYNALKHKKIVIPPKKHTSKSEQYEGAFVKAPICGVHDWVASFDLNSLYPHLIMMYNLSPETLIEYRNLPQEVRDFLSAHGSKINVDRLLKQDIPTELLKKYNLTMTPNGQFFTREKQGFLAEIMERMYNDRAMFKNKATEYKKQLQVCKDENEKAELKKLIAKFNNIQNAKKVTLNSAYGAIGNQYFRFFDIRIAEAITLSGQLAIRWIENQLNDYMNEILKSKNVDYVIASDTDSIYLKLGPLVNAVYSAGGKVSLPKEKVIDFMDKVCDQRIQPFINTSYQKLADYVNAYAQKMIMKREALADRGIWTAKKRYMLNVYDNEGVRYKDEFGNPAPDLKIMGMEAIKSSTPQYCRKKIKEAYNIMISGNELELMKFLEEARADFNQRDADEIAFPRGTSDLGKYADRIGIFTKGTPIHVRGALIFNHHVKLMGLEKKYPLIKDGDKVKFMYVKEPNTLQTDVIAFTNRIPKEFDLDRYLDYNMQYEKAFLDPLKLVLDAIGWKSEKRTSLEDFFG